VPQANANGITIEYESFGSQTDPTLLLIMGLGMQLVAWPEPFCRQLADHGFHVIRYDNRDTGFSTKFEDAAEPGIMSLVLRSALRLPVRVSYTLGDMADDAAALLDALDVESAHLVGASMGGMIAQNMAAVHAGRVLSLTSIMSTSGRRSLPGADARVSRHMRSRPRGNDRDTIIAYNKRMIELIGSPDFPVGGEELLELASRGFDRCYYPPGIIRHIAAIIADGDRRDRLRKIKAPTLVIHGRDDPLVRLAGGVDTAENVPGAKLEIIDGMGHNLPRELWPRLVDLIAKHAGR
jgi:pimeloyl-ACP methyl ester carboxylesterase